MAIAAGRLVLESVPSASEDPRGNHLVCWLKREVPADFLLEFGVCPENRSRGLNIVFFAARVSAARASSTPPWPRATASSRSTTAATSPTTTPRTGPAAAAPPTSARTPASPGRGRARPGFALAEGLFQTVRVHKRGGRIRVTVDDVVAVAFDDDGTTYGPVHAHAGWIGLRQMSHTGRCEYDHLRVFALRDPTAENSRQESSPGGR